MQRLCRFVSYLLLLVFSLVNIAGASAQNAAVLLGEIRSSGKVFILSSAGQWSPAMPAYPLLQNTGIRTEDGTASIFFKDGSRIDLSRNTIASITGEAPHYVIHVEKGSVAFSIAPSASLSLPELSADIVAGDIKDTVVGSVSVAGTCLQVENITGKMNINSSSAGEQTLAAGQKASYGNCSPLVAKGNPKGNPAYPAGEITARNAVLALFGVGATWVYFKAFASPSRF
jgi:hypothetical protein